MKANDLTGTLLEAIPCWMIFSLIPLWVLSVMNTDLISKLTDEYCQELLFLLFSFTEEILWVDKKKIVVSIWGLFPNFPLHVGWRWFMEISSPCKIDLKSMRDNLLPCEFCILSLLRNSKYTHRYILLPTSNPLFLSSST